MIYDTFLKSWEGQKIHWWLFQLYCTIFSYVLNEKLKSDSVLTPYQRIIAIPGCRKLQQKNTRVPVIFKWFATTQLTIHPIDFRRQSRSADKSPQKVGYMRWFHPKIVWMQPGFFGSIHHLTSMCPWAVFQKRRVLVGGIPFFQKTLNSGPCQDAQLWPDTITNSITFKRHFAKIDMRYMWGRSMLRYLRSCVENPVRLVAFAPDPFYKLKSKPCFYRYALPCLLPSRDK